MKTLFTALTMVLVIAGYSFAGTVQLTWDPNTETNLTGYKVYYANTNVQPFQGTGAAQGASGSILIPKGTQTATLSALDPTHPYFFAVTAYNNQGAESTYSNIVSITAPWFPSAVAGVKVTKITAE